MQRIKKKRLEARYPRWAAHLSTKSKHLAEYANMVPACLENIISLVQLRRQSISPQYAFTSR
jgi:hypothetical protein